MRVRFPHGSLIDIAMWWNWQTHDAQNVAPRKAWEFKSPLGYYGRGWASAQQSFISSAFRVRLPDSLLNYDRVRKLAKR